MTINTVNEQGKRTIAERSVEAQFLFDRISKAQEGEIITYAEMDKIIGRSVQKSCRGALQTARNQCRNELRIVFSTISSVGIKRLKNEEIPDLADARLAHIRRTASKGIAETMCSDYSTLPKDQQVKYNTNIAMLSTQRELAKSSSVSAISNEVRATHNTLPIGKVMQLFTNAV